MGSIRRVSVPVILVFATILMTSGIVAAADWPSYRGPEYNGITSETDWSSDWPDAGPKVLWKKSIGIGFSSIPVADGRVYTMGNTGKETNTDVVFCFDAKTGQELWKHSYSCPLQPKNYDGGSLSTPTIDGDKVYTLSKMGDLFCLEAATGKVVWNKQLNKDMGFELPTWHFASSALIVGDRLFLNVGSAGLALNKNTGDMIWNNGKGKCGYATPVAYTIDGQKGLALFGEVTLFGVSQTDGKKLWEFPWKTRYEVNAADPIVTGNKLFISSGYGRGCALIEISNRAVNKLWENKSMRNHMNCCVLSDGFLYGFDDGNLACLKFADGSEQWSEKSLGKGALMMSADGRLICMSDKGELVIAKADPQQFRAIARAQILPAARCWTTPTLANGRIYARNAPGDFVCVDVSSK